MPDGYAAGPILRTGLTESANPKIHPAIPRTAQTLPASERTGNTAHGRNRGYKKRTNSLYMVSYFKKTTRKIHQSSGFSNFRALFSGHPACIQAIFMYLFLLLTAWFCAVPHRSLRSDRRARYRILSCSRTVLLLPDGMPPLQKPPVWKK